MKIRRVVIKIGSSLLTKDGGQLHRPRVARFAYELSKIQKCGVEVVLVSSGAIAAGLGELGWKKRPSELPKKQAAAAVGQPKLMETYRQLFRRYGVRVAQVLLTKRDFENQTSEFLAKGTLEALLAAKVIPIINENDSVAVEEIRVGDNDTLAALVAVHVKADLLVLLTDVEGLLTRHPKDGEGKLIRIVEQIGPSIEAMAQHVPGTDRGTGGMGTKIRAAKIATQKGVAMAIASGKKPGILAALVSGHSAGTYFSPQ